MDGWKTNTIASQTSGSKLSNIQVSERHYFQKGLGPGIWVTTNKNATWHCVAQKKMYILLFLTSPVELRVICLVAKEREGERERERGILLITTSVCVQEEEGEREGGREGGREPTMSIHHYILWIMKHNFALYTKQ